MSRIPALVLAVAAAVCLASTSCSKPRRSEVLCDGCNVVLISMDTVRADHLGAYGYGRPTSPNVDRLADSSFVFENAISQSAWTLPGHGSMMTGLYPSRMGVAGYPAKRSLPKVPMLAEEFSRAGYATGGFTGGGFVSAHFGFNRGFDVYASDGRRFEHNIEEALGWLRTNKDRPFFLFLHGYDAHRPYYSTAVDKEAIGLTGRRAPEQKGFCGKGNREKPANLDLIIKYYDASIHHGDATVGRFLDEIGTLGLAEKTVILLTSDHGEEFFEHGNCDHVRFLYREIVGVPYMLRVPGLAASRIRDIVPASISVARTLLEIVGIESDLPGATVTPLLRGEPSPFRTVYSETDSIAGNLGSRGTTVAVTNSRYRLISYLDEGSDEGYDTNVDRREQHTLPESSPVYQLRTTLRAWYRSLVYTDLRAWKKAVGANERRNTDRETRNDENDEDDDDSVPAPIPEGIQKQLESLGYLDE